MSPPLINAVFLNWEDIAKNQSDGFWTTKNQIHIVQPSLFQLGKAAQALSDAAMFGISQQICQPVAARPVTGPYGTVFDQIVLILVSGNGRREIAIPAPKASLFTRSKSTPNMDDPRIQAFFRAAQMALADDSGALYTSMMGGYRRKVQWSPGT